MRNSLKRILFILNVATTITMAAISSVKAREPAMHSPPWKMQQGERVLDSKEIADLPCTTIVRHVATEHEGTIMESEKVTRSDEFGYIYRYDIVNTVKDDKGQFVIHTVLVVSSRDCKSLEGTMYPMFELPNQKS